MRVGVGVGEDRSHRNRFRRAEQIFKCLPSVSRLRHTCMSAPRMPWTRARRQQWTPARGLTLAVDPEVRTRTRTIESTAETSPLKTRLGVSGLHRINSIAPRFDFVPIHSAPSRRMRSSSPMALLCLAWDPTMQRQCSRQTLAVCGPGGGVGARMRTSTRTGDRRPVLMARIGPEPTSDSQRQIELCSGTVLCLGELPRVLWTGNFRCWRAIPDRR